MIFDLSKKRESLLMIVIFAAVIYLIVNKNSEITESFKEENTSISKVAINSEGYESVGNDKQITNTKLPERSKFEQANYDVHPSGFAHIGVMHAEVMPLYKFLNESEAVRCRVVGERRFDDAHGYYLEALPPSNEQILATRRMIHEIMSKIENLEKKYEIDNNIGSLIYEYDPFGKWGTKIIGIRVPDDPSSPLSAWTYPVEDVEEEYRRIFSGEQITARVDMQFFVGSDPHTLSRFKSLIAQPSTN